MKHTLASDIIRDLKRRNIAQAVTIAVLCAALIWRIVMEKIAVAKNRRKE